MRYIYTKLHTHFSIFLRILTQCYIVNQRFMQKSVHLLHFVCTDLGGCYIVFRQIDLSGTEAHSLICFPFTTLLRYTTILLERTMVNIKYSYDQLNRLLPQAS